MQFSKQTAALAIFLLAGSALASVPTPTQQQAEQVAAELKNMAIVIQQELNECIADPKNNAAECFNRVKGMNLDPSKKMTAADISAATPDYSKLVGKLIADCIKKNGYAACVKKIQDANDKGTFNFKREPGFGFLGGLMTGFTEVLPMAGSMINSFFQ